MPASGVLSSWLASDKKRRRASSMVCKRSAMSLNSAASLADLVISADFGAVAVRAFAHFSNGVGQHAEAPRQHAG